MNREEPKKVKQPNTTAESLSNHLKIGIVGTTNVGKSTLFNCLSKAKVITSPVENELFTTVDPYITIFQPYDERIEYIKTRNPTIVNIKPSQFSVIDTAGLVEGSVRDVS
jgi:small GTP-binding protein